MIYEVLNYGRQNGTTGAELAKMFNCDIRHISAQVRRERLAGHPICASVEGARGYYLPANAAELKIYCGQLYSRGGELFRARRALLDALEKMEKEENEAGSNEP